MNDTAPTLVGSVEAARIIGIDRKYLNSLAQKGEIRTAVKLPGRTGSRLFDVRDVEACRDRRRAS